MEDNQKYCQTLIENEIIQNSEDFEIYHVVGFENRKLFANCILLGKFCFVLVELDESFKICKMPT